MNGRTVAGGANRNGRQLLNETNTQSNKPWKAKTFGRRNIEAYARDLRGVRAI
ncbi:MAG: hypothetical protein HC903_04035 [Methylacidiphilales bacterium]|nr:hypothetical protein [Candidatus Methylacidiphilales bacterium]